MEPELCQGPDGSLNKPLCIAWSSSGRNHFIALVAVKGIIFFVCYLHISAFINVYSFPFVTRNLFVQIFNREGTVIHESCKLFICILRCHLSTYTFSVGTEEMCWLKSFILKVQEFMIPVNCLFVFDGIIYQHKPFQKICVLLLS